MTKIKREEFMNILFSVDITKRLVEKRQNMGGKNITTLVVNGIKTAKRIITCDGVDYFLL